MWHTNLEDMRQGRDMLKWRKSFKKLELEGRSQIAGPKYIVAVTQQYITIYARKLKSTRGLKIHQRSCKNNLVDEKNKLLDEISEPNNIVTKVTENNT